MARINGLKVRLHKTLSATGVLLSTGQRQTVLDKDSPVLAFGQHVIKNSP
jgi:hypothetical protein